MIIAYHNDMKEKHQSVDACIPEIDTAIEELYRIDTCGYGYNEDEARLNLLEAIKVRVEQCQKILDLLNEALKHDYESFSHERSSCNW
jgi:hypothetical protein